MSAGRHLFFPFDSQSNPGSAFRVAVAARPGWPLVHRGAHRYHLAQTPHCDPFQWYPPQQRAPSGRSGVRGVAWAHDCEGTGSARCRLSPLRIPWYGRPPAPRDTLRHSEARPSPRSSPSRAEPPQPFETFNAVSPALRTDDPNSYCGRGRRGNGNVGRRGEGVPVGAGVGRGPARGAADARRAPSLVRTFATQAIKRPAS